MISTRRQAVDSRRLCAFRRVALAPGRPGFAECGPADASETRMKLKTRTHFAAPWSATLALSLGAVGLGAPAHAQGPGPGCAVVEVQNVRPSQGNLMVAAYASAEDFSKKPVTTQRLAAGEQTMRFTLCGLTGSAVALTLYQDLNSDGRMSRNLLGMPTEPWGSSGTPGAMGPTWEGARVALDGSTVIVRMSM
jgi:uncharacterized protein (DUF2141 family)